MLNNRYIKSIKIHNFKSIEYLDLNLNKINIFIGEPNVGKSNILESLGILSALGHRKRIREFIRLKESNDLFYKGSLEREVKFDLEFSDKSMIKLLLSFEEGNDFILSINDDLKGKLWEHRRATNLKF